MNSEGNSSSAAKYWRANLIVISILLSIWFVVAYGCSIFFVEQLNQFKLFNLPLGFWFANQGSIYVFVILIFSYAIIMDRIDKKLKNQQNQSREGK